jgi:hypothetical protein
MVKIYKKIVYLNTRSNKPELCKGLDFKKKYINPTCLYNNFNKCYENTNFYDSQLNNYEFKNLLFQQGRNFERDIIKYINDNIHNVKYLKMLDKDTSLKETIECINKGVPFIHNAYIKDKYNGTEGRIDLLVRNDYIHLLNKNISDIINSNSQEVKNYYYIVIDIKFKTLGLMTNGINLLNNDKTRYFKTQLYLYTKAISYIQKYNCNYACLIGRKYDYTQNCQKIKINNCFDRIALIDFSLSDKSTINISKNIYKLNRNSDILDLCEPIEYSGANYKNIYRKLNPYFDGNIHPLKIKNNLYDWRNTSNKEYFVDFEVFPDIIHSSDNIPNHKTCNILYLIGVGTIINNKFVYKSFKCNKLTLEEENRIITEFKSYIGNNKCWYWSAEENIWNNIKSNMNNYIFFCDLYKIFKNEPILIKDCKTYRLKDIVHKMNKYKLININYDSKCKSGTDSIILAHKYFNYNQERERDTTEGGDINSIIEYNYFDVKSLYEILNYLRKEM